jgi:hypothetical protein
MKIEDSDDPHLTSPWSGADQGEELDFHPCAGGSQTHEKLSFPKGKGERMRTSAFINALLDYKDSR